MRKNRNVSRRIISCILTIALILTGIGVFPTISKASDDVEVVSAVGQTYVEYRTIDDYIIEGARVAPKPTKPEYANWLFAGWYTGKSCSSSQFINYTKGLSGKYYAKYVPEEVLSVKCQVKKNTTASTGTSAMRLLTTVDCLDYYRVGFIVEIDCLEKDSEGNWISWSKTTESREVYQKITATKDGVALSAAPSVFQFTSSKYFATVTVDNIPNEAFKNGIRVTPYWKTRDGAVVKGVARTVRVADSYESAVNVPVQLYSDATIASGNKVTVSYDSEMFTFEGMDLGTITNKVTPVADATNGTVTCTVNEKISADGMLANLRFLKKTDVKAVTTDKFKITSETVSDWNASCQVYHSLRQAITDGCFSAAELKNYSTPVFDLNPTSTTSKAIAKTVTDTGIQYNFKTTSKAIRTISVENTIFNAEEFTKMTVKIRNMNKEAFIRWRLYLNPNLAHATNSERPGTLLVDTQEFDGGAYSSDVLTVSDADVDGWITVTFDLSNISRWFGAGTIKGFSIGYVTTGTTQEIGEIRLSKTGDTLYSDVFTGPELIEHGTVLYDRKTSTATETANSNGVQYDFGGNGTLVKSVVVENVSLKTADYSGVTIRIRATDKTKDFTQFKFRIHSKANPWTAGTGIWDQSSDLIAGSAYSNDHITVSERDVDGWVDVTFHLKTRTEWNNAGTITSFCFEYVNNGQKQEIAEIRFERAARKTLSADILYDIANVYHDYDPTKLIPSTLQNTGVKYNFLDYNRNNMKNIFIEDLDLDPNEYNRITFRIRSLSTDESGQRYGFNNWFLFVDPDSSLDREKAKGTKMLDTRADQSLNADAITVSAADASGWVTVTMDMGNVVEWYGLGAIHGINIGYTNPGVYQELAWIQLDNSKNVSGNFSATYLKQYGVTPIYYGSDITAASEMHNFPNKVVLDDGIKYSYSNIAQIAGNKGVKLTGLSLQTKKYDTMKVRLRALGEYGIDRYKIWLATDAANTLTMELDVDSLGNDVLMQSGPDADGWVTVTVDLSAISKYAQANTLTSLCFTYVSYSDTQEIKDIRFLDTKGDLTADTLYALSTPYKYASPTEKGQKTLSTSKVTYTHNSEKPNAIKAVRVDHVGLIPGRYDTMTVKIRDTNKTSFTRWRLYLDTESGKMIDINTTANLDSSSASTYFTISGPDSSGWVTVKIALGKLAAWTNASVVDGFVLGYLNQGAVQEIESIQFAREADMRLLYNSASPLSQYYAYLLRTEVPDLGNATYSTSSSTTTKDINFATDASLTKGTGTIGVGSVANGVDLTCRVADYYGFIAVLKYLKAHGCVLTPSTTITVDYLDYITGIESATAYAQNKSGEFRVMSYNTLWESDYKDDNGKAVHFGNNAHRDMMQKWIIAQYMPDVLGLQERGKTLENYGGREGLNTNLEGLGYTEVSLDNRSGNYTPIWYNSATMKEVENASGFKLFDTTSLEADKSRGKGYTWAVLQSIKTSEKILVINVHLYTDDATANMSQAKNELIPAINQLAQTYPNMPVMLIGDFNSRSAESTVNDSSYMHFRDELGYVDPVIAATVRNTARTHHGMPLTYAETTFGNMVTRNNEVIQGTHQGDNSMDHILFKDVTKINMNVFGVVVDAFTNITSDHYPIFVDFDVK